MGPCNMDNLCLERIDMVWYGVVLEVFILLICFIGMALVCDDYLVASLETLCVRLGFREDVAGATFMAFGSAAPEIVVNAVSTIKSIRAKANASTLESEKNAVNLGCGAIIGSGVIAFSVIPGLCGVFSHDEELELKRRPLLRDITAYAIALALLCNFCGDGSVSLQEGLMLIAVYVIYIAVLIVSPNILKTFRRKWQRRALLKKKSFVEEREDVLSERLTSEYIDEDSDTEGGSFYVLNLMFAVLKCPIRAALRLTVPPCERKTKWERLYPFTFVLAFLWISAFSYTIAAIVGRWGDLTGISLAYLGFVVVAVGAEVPDTIQSVTVARRGYGSMAVANCTSSQIVNICLGLGLPWTVSAFFAKEIQVTGHVQLMQLAEFQAVNVAIFAFLSLGLALIFRQSKAKLTKRKGFVMLSIFVLIQIGHAVWAS